jgi:hypothetical protein
MPPPQGAPPILLNLDYASDAPPLPDLPADLVTYRDGQLRVATNVAQGNHGIAADQTSYRDVIVEAEVALVEGGDEDLYGLFLRSPEPELYYSFAASPTGHVVISRYDGQHDPIVAGPLAPEMPFAAGIGSANRFQVVALGPSLTFLLNGTVLTTEIVDADYQEGYLGFYVHHGSEAARAELGANWIQVRGIFAEGDAASSAGTDG